MFTIDSLATLSPTNEFEAIPRRPEFSYCGNLQFNLGELDIIANNVSAGSGYSQVRVNGTVSLGFSATNSKVEYLH